MNAALEFAKLVSEGTLLTTVGIGIIAGFCFESKIIDFEDEMEKKISDKLFQFLLPLLKIIKRHRRKRGERGCEKK